MTSKKDINSSGLTALEREKTLMMVRSLSEAVDEYFENQKSFLFAGYRELSDRLSQMRCSYLSGLPDSATNGANSIFSQSSPISNSLFLNGMDSTIANNLNTITNTTDAANNNNNNLLNDCGVFSQAFNPGGAGFNLSSSAFLKGLDILSAGQVGNSAQGGAAHNMNLNSQLNGHSLLNSNTPLHGLASSSTPLKKNILQGNAHSAQLTVNSLLSNPRSANTTATMTNTTNNKITGLESAQMLLQSDDIFGVPSCSLVNDWNNNFQATAALTSPGSINDQMALASPQPNQKFNLNEILTRFLIDPSSINDSDHLHDQLTKSKMDEIAGEFGDLDSLSKQTEENSAAGDIPFSSLLQKNNFNSLDLNGNTGTISSNTMTNVNGAGLISEKSDKNYSGVDIPIETLRNLSGHYFTQSIKAVYEYGRPKVVSIKDNNIIYNDFPTDLDSPEGLGIDKSAKCQVLVEFKLKRLLQYDSDTYVAPGTYVIVGGDRGEDLGLVIYTMLETNNDNKFKKNIESVIHGEDSLEDGSKKQDGGSDEAILNALLPSESLPNGTDSNANSTDSFTHHQNNNNNNNKPTSRITLEIPLTSTENNNNTENTSDSLHPLIRAVGLSGSTLRDTFGLGQGTVLRVASSDDISHLLNAQKELEKRALDVCTQRVLTHRLPMVIHDAEYQFDKKKLTFFYQAQQRLDFRELVRDLYKTFRARIWMELVEE